MCVSADLCVCPAPCPLLCAPPCRCRCRCRCRLQYAEFLQHALPPAEYRALLPSMEVGAVRLPPSTATFHLHACFRRSCHSGLGHPGHTLQSPLQTLTLHTSHLRCCAMLLQELAQEYCIDPELIFSLYRPLIAGIEPPAAPGHEEEEGEIEDAAAAAAAAGATAAAGEAMEEDGQLEAGEVQPSPAKQPLLAAPTMGLPGGAAAFQRWEELEQQVGEAEQQGGASPAVL